MVDQFEPSDFIHFPLLGSDSSVDGGAFDEGWDAGVEFAPFASVDAVFSTEGSGT